MGVFYYGWDVNEIMTLYWAENVVIGFFTLARLPLAQPDNPSRFIGSNKGVVVLRWLAGFLGLVYMMGFFLVHFGLFTALHGAVVYSLFAKYVMIETLWWPLGMLYLSHGLSYLANYVGKEEYLKVTRMHVFFAPYRRVWVMHLTIMVAGGLIAFLNAPGYAVVFLVLLKTLLDLWGHAQEHGLAGS